MIRKMSIEEFLAKTAADDVPGSGSVAALVGAAGLSQLMKIARLSAVSSIGDTEAAALASLKSKVAAIIEEDAAVLNEALPLLLAIGADGDSQEWNAVLTKAAAVMFTLAEQCQQGLRLAQSLLPEVEPNFRCDIKAAALNCHAALQGALCLAELNVALLRDDDILLGELTAKVNDLAEAGSSALDRLLA